MEKEGSGIKESGPRLLPTFRLGADWPAQSFRGGSGSNGTASLLDLLAGGGADAFDLDGQLCVRGEGRGYLYVCSSDKVYRRKTTTRGAGIP